jgi:hypothetical protein
MRKEYEGAMQELVLAEGLKAVPFYGLGGGYLTGKYREPEAIVGSPREAWLRPNTVHLIIRMAATMLKTAAVGCLRRRSG